MGRHCQFDDLANTCLQKSINVNVLHVSMGVGHTQRWWGI